MHTAKPSVIFLHALRSMAPLRASLLTAACVLSGCTSIALNSLNGAGMCPPEAISNAYAIHNLATGESSQQLGALSPPEKTSRLTMDDGSILQILVYRTGHPRCRMETGNEFTPVLVGGGRIIAVGADDLQPYLRRSRNTAVMSDTTPDNYSLLGILMGRF